MVMSQISFSGFPSEMNMLAASSLPLLGTEASSGLVYYCGAPVGDDPTKKQ
jgi:hypothetical protein